MKKVLLIPTTLVTAITPIIATTSCNNTNTPTPDPEVTKHML